MKKALGNVQNFALWQPNAFKGQMKIVQCRLVGFGLLGGDNSFKLHL